MRRTVVDRTALHKGLRGGGKNGAGKELEASVPSGGPGRLMRHAEPLDGGDAEPGTKFAPIDRGNGLGRGKR